MRGLDELCTLVAEAAFLRWQFPAAEKVKQGGLTCFADSVWSLVAAHPGIAPWLLRGDMITGPVSEKIVMHQEELVAVSGITFAQSRWLMLTIALR